ncbi:DUF305 domain-containing protein [Kibdelosporangium persicum]|uniref:DUF305 domain-containing protein n=2 Tax=Kibdelosporangium persicum TaxID=2698649 RepID=A0ABX2FEC7_9PSEU|nr:DUF305 domain-containing protein [Kibdelosporangium persicum]
MRKSLVTATTALVVAVLSTACGSDVPSPETQRLPSGTAAPQADHDEQAVAFARQLIPHLGEVRDLAKLVPSRSTNAAVLDLAARIGRSQTPDIQQLMRWLLMWGVEYVPDTNKEAVRQLQQVDDAQFDRVWTQMTIERHERAIAVAKTQLENGGNPAVRQFAQKIVDTRQAEIDEMRNLA